MTRNRKRELWFVLVADSSLWGLLASQLAGPVFGSSALTLPRFLQTVLRILEHVHRSMVLGDTWVPLFERKVLRKVGVFLSLGKNAVASRKTKNRPARDGPVTEKSVYRQIEVPQGDKRPCG